MPKLVPSEAQAPLQVGTPNISIELFQYPSSAAAGAAIEYRIQMRNSGDIAIMGFMRLTNTLQDKEIFYHSKWLEVGEVSMIKVIPDTMPDVFADLTLLLESGHLVYVSPDYVWTVTDSQTATVLLEVPTGISVALSTPTAAPGETVTVDGVLNRIDVEGGGPLEGMSVEIWINTVLATTVLTDTTGRYESDITAPVAVGTYIVKALFAGFEALGAAQATIGLAVTGATWEMIVAWWNSLPWWQKALILGGGGAAAVGSIYAVARRRS